MTGLGGDIGGQTRFVAQSAWRLMAMQDGDPLSPSHGCFHYSYWRDKTSEFPDGRFQEAAAALALLSLPAFGDRRAEAGSPSPEALMAAFSAGLANWAAQQYPEGCFDEWYKGERGYAVTHFTMMAFGLVAWLMPDRLPESDLALLRQVMTRAGRWLLGRHDRVKTNHEAAAAAAQALAWAVTGEDAFRADAADKARDTLARGHDEGWFPEIGGADLGYSTLILDCLMLYGLICDDSSVIAPMRRLFAFFAPYVLPDFTMPGEAGLCRNGYLGRLGIILLSPHDDGAAALLGALEETGGSNRSLAPTLADDLRLARWSYLPLAAELLAGRGRRLAGGLAAVQPEGWIRHEGAALAAYHGGGWTVTLAGAGGGAVRVYRGSRLLAEDQGVAVRIDGRSFTAVGYDPVRVPRPAGEGMAVRVALGPAAYFFPGFLQRLVLRLGSTTALGSRLLRAGIDAIRMKRKSAVNQSAGGFAGSGGDVTLERIVAVDADCVRIHDRLALPRPPKPGEVRPLLRGGDGSWIGAAPCGSDLLKTIAADGTITVAAG